MTIPRSLAGVLALAVTAGFTGCGEDETVTCKPTGSSAACLCVDPPPVWMARGLVDGGNATVDVVVGVGEDAGSPEIRSTVPFKPVGSKPIASGDYVLIDSHSNAFALTGNGATATCQGIDVPFQAWIGVVLAGTCQQELQNRGLVSPNCHDVTGCGCSTGEAGFGFAALGLAMLRRCSARARTRTGTAR